MRAVRITGYGEEPVVEEVPTPSVQAGQVLIRVAGAAVNPLDLKIMKGWMAEFMPVTFPYTLGTDVSGTIEAIGDGVDGWAVGEPVLARLDPRAGGAFADLAVIPATDLVRAPASVPLPLASGIVTAAATAWQALTEIADGVDTGTTVLVQGGAGGVGSFTVQIARTLGARVLATASPTAVETVRGLGAHEVIDYTVGDVGHQVSDVDVVIDTVGGATAASSIAVLRPGGLMVALPEPPDADRAAGAGVRAEWVVHENDPARLRSVTSLVDEQGLRVLHDQDVPLGEAIRALEELERGHLRGKIILVP
jgi:NADPH:quinone reductase-like Zn-dependent oxidoreductase